MDRHRVLRWVTSIALAGMLAGSTVGPVAGQEIVTVSSITFDRVAHLCGQTTASGCVRLTGTMTCASAGFAQLVNVFLDQRGLIGLDNLDLLDFACSPEPRSFTVVVENEGCGFTNTPAGCFRPGPATVRAVVFRGPVITEQSVLIRKA